MLKLCLSFLLGLFLLAFLAPFIAPFDVLEDHLTYLHVAPSLKFLLGTDFLGRDIFSRLIFALRNSLVIGLSSSFLALVLALLYLVVARVCFYAFFMRLLDFFLGFPWLLLLMFFQSFFSTNLFVMIILIALIHWCFIARILESNLQKLETLDFYKASLVLGRSKFKAFFKDLLPALRSLIFVLFVFNVVHAIATEATLSFFGLGLGFENPTLGTLLNDASKAIFIGAWWMVLFPLLTLVLLFIALLGLGNSLQKIWGVKS